MEQREPIIRLEHLVKEFKTSGGTVRALEDINLDIYAGEIFGIIGLSGAGKSTLVRCINYLETPTSGEVISRGGLSTRQANSTLAIQINQRRAQERLHRADETGAGHTEQVKAEELWNGPEDE